MPFQKVTMNRLIMTSASCCRHIQKILYTSITPGHALVELKRSPAEALQLLEQSLRTATVVKPLPAEARYYLGRAQQMSGKYSDAIKSYNLFTEEAGKKAAREKGTEELIRQCKEGKGEIKEIAVASAEKTKPDTVPVTKAGKQY